MSTNIGTEDPPLLWLLLGVGLLVGGLAFGGGWWVLDGNPLGGLLVVMGVVVSLLIAFGYARAASPAHRRGEPTLRDAGRGPRLAIAATAPRRF